jgi:transcriptional regulator with XRE-family HTH domain
MPTEPPVLTRLKALGLRQSAIARYLGASTSAVSSWCIGKNPFEDPWLTEAQVLLAVLYEHLTQGGTLANFTYRPSLFMNPGGVTSTGETSIPDDAVADYAKMREAIRGLPPEHQSATILAWHAKYGSRALAESFDVDPLLWDPPAAELDMRRREVDALRLFLLGRLQAKARKALGE